MKKFFYSMMAVAIAASTFTSCEDVPEPYNNPYDNVKESGAGSNETIEPKGTGTLADPFNVAAALAKCEEVGEAGTEGNVYAEGYVTSITEIDASNYGNATFTISDTKEEGGNSLTVYRAYGLDNKKITDKNLIKEGDKVVICGQLVNFKGNTPEFTQGCYIVSINASGNAGGDDSAITPTGDGTQANPFNIAAALAKCQEVGEAGTSGNVYAIGYVTSITEIDASTYGNATFTVSDTKEGANSLTVYRAYGLGNQKITDPNLIKVGDLVVICGQLVNFKGNTPEFTQGCYIVSINGAGDTGGNDSTVQPEGDGTQANPFNVAAALAKCAEVGETETESEFYATGYVTSVTEISTSFGNATFIISDTKDAVNSLTVYRAKGLNNEEITDENIVKVGDKVVIYGKLVNYKGNTPEFTQGCYIVSIDDSEREEEGDTPTPPAPSGDNLLANGDFETWSGGLPVYWKSASTASNATLSQSTDAHTGSYSVRVAHDASANKRLAYKEITLKAGDYTLKFYAKSASTSNASVRPGYTTIDNDGKANSNYTYGDYTNDITNAGWVEVTHSFSLSSDTKLCLVFMNPKSSEDLLIDDVELIGPGLVE